LSLPRIIFFSSVVLFIAIGSIAAVKKLREGKQVKANAVVRVQDPPSQMPTAKKIPMPATQPIQMAKEAPTQVPSSSDKGQPVEVADDFPVVDRMDHLFSTKGYKLPIIETISYSSRVDWLKGRPAWIADYAVHHGTSRHFIARSLNGRPDYFSQKVSTASRFNVFRRDKDIQFYLLIDISRCKLALYYLDLGTNERVLLKTYSVGLGGHSPQSASGCLTPLGTYSLGNKIAIYKPGIIGQYQNKPVEMVRIFGTRWIPFEQAFEGCTAIPKGYGLLGAPFEENESKELVENRSCIGRYESDGCIRLSSEDVEEIFSIVITKPSFAVIVKDFKQAKLPGVEVSTPSR
jgi:hypothetical protein